MSSVVDVIVDGIKGSGLKVALDLTDDKILTVGNKVSVAEDGDDIVVEESNGPVKRFGCDGCSEFTVVAVVVPYILQLLDGNKRHV